MSLLRRYLDAVNMLGIPHRCLGCGGYMSFGRSEGGRWFACCPQMWIFVGDNYVEHNYDGHSWRLLSRPPRWGDCGHDHELRRPLRGYPV